jgi:hypothetical protein
MTELKFVRPRRIEEVTDYESSEPWLADIEPSLSAAERAQLVYVIQLFDPSLDEAAIFSGSYSRFANGNGIAEVPIEWWDIEDETGTVRHQLWLCCADAGFLFTTGTTTLVEGANIARCAFYGDGWQDGRPGSLAALLDAAQRSVAEDTELAGIAFVERKGAPRSPTT